MGARNPDVDAWFERYDNPMKGTVERAREVILAADDRIGEVIKWSTPTFVYKGNLASFQPRAKQFVSILFHEGASIPGSHSLLEGGGDHARATRESRTRTISRHAARSSKRSCAPGATPATPGSAYSSSSAGSSLGVMASSFSGAPLPSPGMGVPPSFSAGVHAAATRRRPINRIRFMPSVVCRKPAAP